jgi:hypothetical protein
VLAIIDGGDASFTREEAEANLNSVTVSFTLDDAPLSTTRTDLRTALKPSLDPGLFGLRRRGGSRRAGSCRRPTSALVATSWSSSNQTRRI